MHVTAPSTWPCLDHSVSGLIPRTRRPIKTRFRYAYTYRLKLARETKSMTHYTKGTLSGRKGPPTDCRRSVSGTVSLPSSGCFSPFPHGTGSLSVSKEYLAFEGGPPIFRQNFTCSALLNTSDHASYTGLSPTMVGHSRPFYSQSQLGWSPFARRY